MRRNLPSWSYPNWKVNYSNDEIIDEAKLPIVGGGRSFGDSNFLGNHVSSPVVDELMTFDSETCLATFSGSVSIYDALSFLLSRSRTLPIIPGTMHATIGGCIASDVHGKNSFKKGPFSQHLKSFRLETPTGIIEITDPDSEGWKCTVGGQGLSGRITSATVHTEEILSTSLESKVVRTKNLEEHFELISKFASGHDFVVGWIDGDTPGFRERGYIEFCDELNVFSKEVYELPNLRTLWKNNYPRVKVVNWISVGLFNYMNHFKSWLHSKKTRTINRWDYMFPMSSLGNWNYFFGHSGFHEIQFSCNQDNIESGIRLIREIISQQRIFLIGIKLMSGTQNGYLAFPGRKWSIAVNFPATSDSPATVRRYQDQIILFEGRINPTKDWCADKRIFQTMYPNWKKVQEYRESNGVKIESSFSKRVGISP